VIFFNNVGYLGMCGHGTIGLVVTLAHLGRIQAGEHRIETPVGVITAQLHESGEVSVRNVPSYRYAKAVSVEVAGQGTVTGDIAWGGKLVLPRQRSRAGTDAPQRRSADDFTWRLRQALERHGITGKNGQEIDHIELFAPSPTPGVHSRNFVLCPAKPTTARLRNRNQRQTRLPLRGRPNSGRANLAAGEHCGKHLRGDNKRGRGELLPTIRGSAFVNAEATLILNPADPYCGGIR